MFDQWRQYITTEFTKVVVLPRDLHNRGNLHNRGTSHYRGDKLPCTMTPLKDVWLCLIRCIKVKCIMLSCVMLTKLCVSHVSVHNRMTVERRVGIHDDTFESPKGALLNNYQRKVIANT